jgi:hypothetical protein
MRWAKQHSGLWKIWDMLLIYCVQLDCLLRSSSLWYRSAFWCLRSSTLFVHSSWLPSNSNKIVVFYCDYFEMPVKQEISKNHTPARKVELEILKKEFNANKFIYTFLEQQLICSWRFVGGVSIKILMTVKKLWSGRIAMIGWFQNRELKNSPNLKNYILRSQCTSLELSTIKGIQSNHTGPILTSAIDNTENRLYAHIKLM